jgi:hypothetical protein
MPGRTAFIPVLVLQLMTLSCSRTSSLEPAPEQVSEEEPEGSHTLAALPAGPHDFLKLFNGRNLDGWTIMGDPAGWSVQDGVIRSEGGKGGGWLRFNEPQSDFVFKLDWKVSRNGNAGAYIRAAEEGLPWETGYEIQITNEPRDDLHCTCALYGHAAVDPRPDESADTWHTFEIHVAGTHITVYADGVKCVEADQKSMETARDKPLTGFIGIQDSHAGKGSYVEYRNIRLKLLG